MLPKPKEYPALFCIFLIKCYQRYISPLLGRNCRFEPTCSEYAKQAISIHGVLYGSYLAAVRLAKCGPWHTGGYDPVPPRRRLFRRG